MNVRDILTLHSYHHLYSFCHADGVFGERAVRGRIRRDGHHTLTMSVRPLAIVPALLSLLLLGAGCVTDSSLAVPKAKIIDSTDMIEQPKYAFPGVLDGERIADKQIRIHTEKGDIVFELFDETAPKTVSNFVYLTELGYYDGLTFHRREEGFVIQGGDPKGNGTGGPGYKFEDELADDYEYDRGIVAMANSGSNTNGSQFFIMLADTPLPKNYSIFGRVIEGMDVVDAIVVGDKMLEVTVEAKEE